MMRKGVWLGEHGQFRGQIVHISSAVMKKIALFALSL
jgi:hypothetical protein